MNTEVIGWINRPGYRGVVVKENGKVMSLNFTKIIQLLDRVDRKTWEELSRYYLCLDGHIDDHTDGYIDRCTDVPGGLLTSRVERKVKQV